ncbi:MAG TPA: hypothetical protein VK596_05905 [Edaphobacter sp.]|nr:hypothetical protein [Edaphobacter sp.]
MMKAPRVVILSFAGSLIFAAGCASPQRYAYAPPPPPPPPYAAAPPLVEQARHEGFRMGSDAGVRDAYRGFGYQPRRGPAFHNTPGYDPALGPYGPYRDAFRQAYLQGYDRGFYRH